MEIRYIFTFDLLISFALTGKVFSVFILKFIKSRFSFLSDQEWLEKIPTREKCFSSCILNQFGSSTFHTSSTSLLCEVCALYPPVKEKVHCSALNSVKNLVMHRIR